MASNNIAGIDHIGITVPDIDSAAAFLTKAFEAESLYDLVTENDEPQKGPEAEQQLGIPQGSEIIRMRFMRLKNGPGIELFQFEKAPQAEPVSLNDFGITHFALYVTDLEEAAKKAEEAGARLLRRPHPLAGIEDGTANGGVYMRAPWGSLIELITLESGLQDEELTGKRWKPKM